MTHTPYQSGTVRVGYLQWKYLITQGLLSALIVVFYTMDKSFIRSIHQPEHIITFVLTFILMTLLAYVCGVVSANLDKQIPWCKDVTSRRLLQIGLGVIAVSVIALHAVYLIYHFFLQINLWETDYLSRDFIVVQACVAGINFHHHNIYLRFLSNSAPEEKSAKGPPLPTGAVEDELGTRFLVVESGRAIPAARVAAFFLEDIGKKSKIVRLLHSSGRVYTLDEEEVLATIKSTCPFLFINVSRYYLVNRYAITGVHACAKRRYELLLDVPDTDPVPISRDMYRQLQEMSIDAAGEAEKAG